MYDLKCHPHMTWASDCLKPVLRSIQGSFLPTKTDGQVTWNRMVLGEERWLLRFQILGPYPKPTDSAYLEWELAFLKQACRWILSALGFNSHDLIAIPPSFLGPLPYTCEFLRLWLISLSGSQSVWIPEDSRLEFDPLAKNFFPIPPNNVGCFFQAGPEERPIIVLILTNWRQSGHKHPLLCLFSSTGLGQGCGRAAEKLLEGGLGGTQRKIIRTATPSVIKS